MKCRVGRDVLTSTERSRLMARIRQKHTAPELVVRSVLHQLGLRFTVEGPLNRWLPGRPDIVLPRHRAVVFVHGCFWHRHKDCVRTTTPSTRRAFWLAKFRVNQARDRRVQADLHRMGWRVHVIWECETKDLTQLHRRLRRLFAIAGEWRTISSKHSARAFLHDRASKLQVTGSPPHSSPPP